MISTTRIALNKYCVYKHLIDKKLFYVGKGVSSRPFSSEGRNDKWMEITKKVGYFDVEIVACFNDPKAAEELEESLIKALKPSANYLHNTKTYNRVKQHPKTYTKAKILDRRTHTTFKDVQHAKYFTKVPKGLILKELLDTSDKARFVEVK